MGSDQSPESLGIIALIGMVILYFIVRKFAPTFAAAILITGGIAVLLLLFFVGFILYLAFHKPKESRSEDTESDASAILQKGRMNLLELRKLGFKVKNQQIRSRTEIICKSVDKIFSVLKEQPEQIPQIRKVLNYYLPTLGIILEKYKRLEEYGIPDQQMTDNTIACLENIDAAMEKQYISLFEHDILDLSVEMEVLTSICKRDGLLTDEDFKPQTRKQEITLTL